MMQKPVRIFLLAWAIGIVSLSARAADIREHAETGYIIGQGDVLVISLWKDESLTREVVVLPDGTISFPLIGIAKAEGKTLAELKRDIEERIVRFVPEPVLTVTVKSANSMFIYVIGRVNNPGRFFLSGNVNVLQALAMAGGLNPFANKNSIKIIRDAEGTGKIIRFRYSDVIKGKSLEQNIFLMRGDVVVVP